MFKFEGLSLGNRLVIKFGCFRVRPSAEENGVNLNDTNQLLVILFTTHILEKLLTLCFFLLRDESTVCYPAKKA